MRKFTVTHAAFTELEEAKSWYFDIKNWERLFSKIGKMSPIVFRIILINPKSKSIRTGMRL